MKKFVSFVFLFLIFTGAKAAEQVKDGPKFNFLDPEYQALVKIGICLKFSWADQLSNDNFAHISERALQKAPEAQKFINDFKLRKIPYGADNKSFSFEFSGNPTDSQVEDSLHNRLTEIDRRLIAENKSRKTASPFWCAKK